MPFEFINLNPSLFVAVNCDNRKAMRKEKVHRSRLERSTKNNNIELNGNNDKIEIKFTINKELRCK